MTGSSPGRAAVGGPAPSVLPGPVPTRPVPFRSVLLRSLPLTVSIMVGGAVLGAVTGAGTADRIGFAVMGAGCALLIMIDLAVHRLPDRVIWPMTAAIVVLSGIQAGLDADPGRWGRALLAAVAAGLLLLIMAVISPAGLGLGDVKLAVPLGFALGWFGWGHVGAGLLAAFVINGVVLGVLVLTRRAHRGDDVPFGPSLVLGALLGGVVMTVWS